MLKEQKKYYDEDIDVNSSDDDIEESIAPSYDKYVDLYNGSDELESVPLRRYTAKKASKATRDRKKFSRRRLEEYLEKKALRKRDRYFDDYDDVGDSHSSY